jgi:hypothetical protein
MTADLVKGKSFRGALRYNLEKVETQDAKVLDTNFSSIAERDIMKEIFLVRIQRPALSKYFYHTSLNFPPDENLLDEKTIAIAKEFMYASGFRQHQYILFRHYDAGHPHVHLLVNRIGFDGSLVSDSRDYAKAEHILRQIEVRHGLRQVPSSKYTRERAVTHDELEMMKRTEKHSTKVKVQAQLRNILSQKLTMGQFIEALERKRINVLFNQATTGYISGISFGYQGMLFKGGSLGNAYKWNSIKNSIDYNLERDRESIKHANARTRSFTFKNTDSKLNQEYNLGAVGVNKNSTAETKLTGQSAAPLSISTSQLPRTTKAIGASSPTPEQAFKITSVKDHLPNDTTNGLKQTIGNGLINLLSSNAGNSYHDNTGVSTSSNNQRRRKKRRRRI